VSNIKEFKTNMIIVRKSLISRLFLPDLFYTVDYCLLFCALHIMSRLIIFLVCIKVYFNKMVSELLSSECRVREKERVKQCEKKSVCLSVE